MTNYISYESQWNIDSENIIYIINNYIVTWHRPPHAVSYPYPFEKSLRVGITLNSVPNERLQMVLLDEHRTIYIIKIIDTVVGQSS